MCAFVRSAFVPLALWLFVYEHTCRINFFQNLIEIENPLLVGPCIGVLNRFQTPF